MVRSICQRLDQVPYLILVEPILLAPFVIDFNGPELVTDTDDARSLPMQAVRDVRNGFICQVFPAVIDHQAFFAEVVDAMGTAITVVLLTSNFVGDGDSLEKRFVSFTTIRLMPSTVLFSKTIRPLI